MAVRPPDLQFNLRGVFHQNCKIFEYFSQFIFKMDWGVKICVEYDSEVDFGQFTLIYLLFIIL